MQTYTLQENKIYFISHYYVTQSDFGKSRIKHFDLESNVIWLLFHPFHYLELNNAKNNTTSCLRHITVLIHSEFLYIQSNSMYFLSKKCLTLALFVL